MHIRSFGGHSARIIDLTSAGKRWKSGKAMLILSPCRNVSKFGSQAQQKDAYLYISIRDSTIDSSSVASQSRHHETIKAEPRCCLKRGAKLSHVPGCSRHQRGCAAPLFFSLSSTFVIPSTEKIVFVFESLKFELICFASSSELKALGTGQRSIVDSGKCKD